MLKRWMISESKKDLELIYDADEENVPVMIGVRQNNQIVKMD